MPNPPRWTPVALWLGDLHRRLLPAYFAVLGPRWSYAVMATVGGWLYRLMPPLRARLEGQLRTTLARQATPTQLRRMAESAWRHRVWNLADLMLADRRLNARTYVQCGGRVPEPHLSEMLAAQRRGQPAILVSAYYGPFDLLPVFLGYNGIRAAAVYLPHANIAFDQQRLRIRARSGCEMIPIDRALTRMREILATGGSVAIVADHYAEKRGVPVSFLGRPTTALKSVGLLACRFNADVVVAGVRRVGVFQFAIEVADVMKHPVWAGEPDPVRYITQRYTAALERLIVRDPAQYLWLEERWGPTAGAADAAGPIARSNDLPNHSCTPAASGPARPSRNGASGDSVGARPG